MEKHNLLERKARLLNAAKRIIGLRETEIGLKALNSLKTLKECDKKVVARYAKGVKDPEPLASTMILMARKTPFLARKSFLSHFSPQEIEEAFDCKEDGRVPGRVFCSKRAFDMWLAKDVSVSEQTQASIDVMYKQSRDMVSSFFSYDWPNAKIEVGYLPKARRRVQTRIPLVDVPPQYRQAVVVELLAPGTNIYSDIVNENYMQTLRPLLKDHIITGMHFVEQARILLNLMDPRYKWVPTVPLDDGALALHSHCVFGANWRVVELTSAKPALPCHQPNMRADLNLLLRTVKDCCTPSQARKELATVTYQKETLSDYLQRQQDIPPVQYLKALLKIECTNQFDYMNYRLIVQDPSITPIISKSASGVIYKEYSGEETVHFSSSAIKGYFRHSASHVSQIVMTFSDRRTIVETVAMVGCYCKWGWRFSTKRTIGLTHRECKEKLLRNPELLIGASPANWATFMAHIQSLDLSNPVLPVECEGTAYGGILRIVTEAADPQPFKVLFEITADWTLQSQNPPATIRWEETRITATSTFLSPEWDSTSPIIIPALAPSKSFPRTLKYHASRRDLYDDITKHRFQIFNDHCLSWITPQEKDGFSTLAKAMLKEAINDMDDHSNVYLAFLYMFAGTTHISLATTGTTIFNGQGTLTLQVDRGVFRWERLEHGGRWLFFDHSVSIYDNQKLVSPSTLVLGTLEGYRFDNPRKRTAECAFGKAQESLKRKPDLSSMTVRVSGVLLELVRDRTAQVRAGHSLKRALERLEEERNLELDEEVRQSVKKRRLGDPSTSKE